MRLEKSLNISLLKFLKSNSNSLEEHSPDEYMKLLKQNGVDDNILKNISEGISDEIFEEVEKESFDWVI